MYTSDTFKPDTKVNLYFRDDSFAKNLHIVSVDSYGITVEERDGTISFYTYNYVDMMKFVGGAK